MCRCQSSGSVRTPPGGSSCWYPSSLCAMLVEPEQQLWRSMTGQGGGDDQHAVKCFVYCCSVRGEENSSREQHGEARRPAADSIMCAMGVRRW
jgi:hypothetical protein